jgi:hypothetical protein
LRIVYSFDYYNATEYQQEDLMPYRCGVLHVRGSHLSRMRLASMTPVIYGEHIRTSYDPTSLSRIELDEWCRIFEIHTRQFVEARDSLDLDVAKRMGLRELAQECLEFIAANCHQLEKDVWYCPLSDKRFKGPDYVRKHIETKHPEKLAEVRFECEYFNRFLLDPKRPYLPEHPLSRSGGGGHMNQMGGPIQSLMGAPPGGNSLMGAPMMNSIPMQQPMHQMNHSGGYYGQPGGGYDDYGPPHGRQHPPDNHQFHQVGGHPAYYEQDYYHRQPAGPPTSGHHHTQRYNNYDRYQQQQYPRGGSNYSSSSMVAQGRLVDTRRK